MTEVASGLEGASFHLDLLTVYCLWSKHIK